MERNERGRVGNFFLNSSCLYSGVEGGVFILEGGSGDAIEVSTKSGPMEVSNKHYNSGEFQESDAKK